MLRELIKLHSVLCFLQLYSLSLSRHHPRKGNLRVIVSVFSYEGNHMNPASPGVEERHVFGDPVVFGAVVGVGGEVEAAGGLAAHGPVHGVVEGALHAGHLERRRTSVSMRGYIGYMVLRT